MESLKDKWWIILIAVTLAYWSYSKMQKTSTMIENAIEQSEDSPGMVNRPPADTGRVAEIRKIIYRDHTNAMALLEQVLATPANDSEKASALLIAPEVMNIVMHKKIDAKQYDEAEAILQRMRKDFPGDDRTRASVYSWGQALGQRIRDNSAAENEAGLDTAFSKFVEGGCFLPMPKVEKGNDDGFKHYAAFKMKQWLKLPAEARFKEPGLAMLTQAFGVILDHNDSFHTFFNPVKERGRFYGEDFAKQAAIYETGRQNVQALNAYILAVNLGRSSGKWTRTDSSQGPGAMEAITTEIDYKIAAIAAALAVQSHNQPGSVNMAMRPPNFLWIITQEIQSMQYRTYILNQRLVLQGADFMASTAPLMAVSIEAMADESLPYSERYRFSEMLHEGRRKVSEVFRESPMQVFECMMSDTNPAVWNNIAPAVVEKVREQAATNKYGRLDERMRTVYRRMVRNGEAPMPVALSGEVQARHYEILARSGANLLTSNREEAARALRPVVRQYGNDGVKRQIQRAIEKCILDARKNNKFEPLIELAALYAAEFGDMLGAGEFRKSYREALESAAGQFMNKDPMKAIFVKALLASAFRGEPVGIEAQKDSVKMAMASVAGVTAEEDLGNGRLAVSTVPGYSSVAVDNSTEYHILVFYEGPESAAVLCNPYRRGTFLVKNGVYEVAVLAPSGSIRPYHARLGLKDEHRKSVYHIVQQGGAQSGSTMNDSSAGGEYILLRTPEGLPPVNVDPRTGVVQPGR